MAATLSDSEPVTASCSHCGKEIPTSNIQLHHAHCSRNLERCAICGDMVPKKHADEHYHNNHAPVDCSLCSETVEREVLALHKGEKCPQRIITCEYCEFPLPAVDLFKHQEVCGNRTEYCDTCSRYVRLRERNEHELRFHNNSNGAAESSRVENREDGGGGGGRRRQARDAVSRRHIMFTIAVTGAAVVIGSMFLQKRVDSQEPQ